MAGGDGGLGIDRGLFAMAFGRDVDYHDTLPQLIYLDRQTGDIVWLYGSDDDATMEAGIPADQNRMGRQAIKAEPERYLEIPGLDHDDHHRILRRFLMSDWTRDKGRRHRAEDAYRGSIRQVETRRRRRRRHPRLLRLPGCGNRGDGQGVPPGEWHRASLEVIGLTAAGLAEIPAMH